MLQIIINKSYSLQLEDTFSMPVIDENPLFINDRIPVAHTINLSAPKTPDNMLFFGFPNRSSTSKIMERYNAEIFHFGALVMEGQLIIIDVQQMINFQFINAFMPIEAKRNMNRIDFGERDFGTAHATIETLAYYNSMYDDYKAAMLESVVTPDEFVTAPVRLSGVMWDGHIAAWGMKNAISMYINYYNPIDQSWSMPPIIAMIAQALFPIIPFPYVHVLFDKVFGEKLENNPFFDDANLRKLVMLCFNHKNFQVSNLYKTNSAGNICYVFPLVDDYTATAGLFKNKWQLNSFMQQYPFSEFMKNLISLFGMSCFIGRKIEFIYNNDLLETEEIFVLNDFVSGEPIVSSEKGKVYILTYGEEKTSETNNIAVPMVSGSPSDAYFDILSATELTKSYKISNNPNVVYELTKQAVGVPLEGQDQKFIVNAKITTPALSIQKYEPDPDAEEVIETHEVRIDVKPLETNIEHYWNELFNQKEEAINRGHWFVPVMPQTDLSAPPYIMLDFGSGRSISNQGHTYRQLHNHHTDAQGVKSLGLSLLINQTDPDGVFNKYHKKMAAYWAKDKLKLTVTAILTPIQNRQITNRMKIHVFGRNFHVLKREYTLSNDRFVKVTFYLIEAFSVLSDDE